MVIPRRYDHGMSDPHESGLTAEEVKKIAALARLEIPDGDVARVGADLSAILGYVERLRGVDLEGVEPMAHVGDEVNRLDEDVAGETLSNEVVRGLAPESVESFIAVPRVLGEGGGA